MPRRRQSMKKKDTQVDLPDTVHQMFVHLQKPKQEGKVFPMMFLRSYPLNKNLRFLFKLK